jgi:glycosyltransferase involved in cell wall biosynthesis
MTFEVAALRDAAKPVLVCFSHLRWRFVYQRPQHLMTRAASQWTVYFVEEPVFEDGLSEPRVDFSEGAPGVTITVPVLPSRFTQEQMDRAQEDVVDLIMDRHRGATIAFWYYTPRAVRFTLRREPDLCVYDCMDELSAFKGAAPDLADLEAQLFALSDLVFTGGRALYEAKSRRHPNVHLFPSSVDKKHFEKARSRHCGDPPDQAGIAHPRIGFFGVVDERFDAGLTAALAEIRPDLQFVVLGPVVKIDPSTLPQRNNLHWLGCKTYEELPAYLAYWDAGFMPFALNAATRFISPTKTPEFLAAGLPVVSTAVRDVVREWGDSGQVDIARTPEEFSERLSDVLSRPRAQWLARVDRSLAKLSWDDTWRRMSVLMYQELNWRLQWQELSHHLDEEASLGAEADNV